MDQITAQVTSGLNAWRARTWLALFTVGILVAYFPFVSNKFTLGLYDSHFMYTNINDPPGLFFREAIHLISIARPIPAAFTNITFWSLIRDLSDLRLHSWFRMFTLIMLGWQFIYISKHYLKFSSTQAVACSLCIFVIPSFHYAVINPTGYVPFLVTIFLMNLSYIYISKKDPRFIIILFYSTSSNGNERFIRKYVEYLTSKPVLLFLCYFLLAMYDYPPNALLIFVYPVARLLFAPIPYFLRVAFALRDIVLFSAAMIIYFLATKLIYFPVVKIVFALKTYREGDQPEYIFGLIKNPWVIFDRFFDVMRVAGDLWLFPQAGLRYVYLMILAVALFVIAIRAAVTAGASLNSQATADGVKRFDRDMFRSTQWRAESRPSFSSRLHEIQDNHAVVLALTAVIFVLTAVPIILPSGGFIDYRTIVAPTATAAMLFAYLICILLREVSGQITRLSPLHNSQRLRQVVLGGGLLSLIAFVNYEQSITVELAKRELAYIHGHVRAALSVGAKTIIMVDPRATLNPRELKVTADRDAKPTMPYIFGCYSIICSPSIHIFKYSLQEMGLPFTALEVEVLRGEAFAGVKCEMFDKGQIGQSVNIEHANKFICLRHCTTVANHVEAFRRAGKNYCFSHDQNAWHVY